MEEVTVNIYSHKQEIVEKMLKEELAIMREENDALKAELATARKIISRVFKHIERVELVTCMGEHNVIMAEEFLKE